MGTPIAAAVEMESNQLLGRIRSFIKMFGFAEKHNNHAGSS
jgi:hypothetical protein